MPSYSGPACGSIRGSIKTPPDLQKKYHVGVLLGSGGFGKVYSGNRIEDNLPVAIKRVPNYYITEWMKRDNGCTAPKEVGLLEKVASVQGVAKFLDYYRDTDSHFIVMDRPSESMDLEWFVSEKGALDERLSRRLFHQVVKSVVGCFESGVVHRDIKYENVVLSLSDMKTSIVDFGSGALLKDSPYLTFTTGTPIFNPPEWHCRKVYEAYPGTVWSLGTLLYCMACGKPPFESIEEVLRAEVSFNRILSAECEDLVRQCLSLKAYDRPTLEEILDHVWT